MENIEDRARELDKDDSLAFTRREFNIPTKADIASTRLADKCITPPASYLVLGPSKQHSLTSRIATTTQLDSATEGEKSVYLCGNSLGLQPKRTVTRIQQYLDTWATQGVQGHFKPLEESPLPTWLNADEKAAELMAPIVGADKSEVNIMQTLTANLHFLMSAFYRPDINGRHKIILESKAFPSDHVCNHASLVLRFHLSQHDD